MTSAPSLADTPCVFHGALIRLATLPTGSGRFEIWSKGAWHPTGEFSVADLMNSRPASAAELRARGVPLSVVGE